MPIYRSVAVVAVSLMTLGTGACMQSASAPPPAAVAAVAVAPLVALPGGTGCSAQIGRTRAVVESDVSTGNLAKSVGGRFGADLDQAQGACSAGRDADAMRLLAAAKSRYGYP